MSEKFDFRNQIIDFESGDISGSSSSRGQGHNQNITINDASTISAKLLIPELGSDEDFIIEGKVDVRRFSHINELDVIWLTWFSLVPVKYGGGYSRNYCNVFLNHMYSVNGRHKGKVVEMQKAITGGVEEKKKPQKKGIRERLFGGKQDEE